MEEILPFRALLGVPIFDNGERLVVLQEEVPEIECRYEKLDMVELLGEKMRLREGNAVRLRRAAALLERCLPDARLRVVYAYRHPRIQKKYFDSRLGIMRDVHPGLSEDDLIELAHQQCAYPPVAGHPTGAAVDVTIVVGGVPLDMGTNIADFDAGDRIQTFYPFLSDQQRSNRALLRSIMMGAGFAPYNGEWWHFSYGDREWAAYWGESSAIYAEIDVDSA